MFESAIDAAESAARTWTPACAEPGPGSGCCPLCLHRYRRLVLDGPLRMLPHAVAHAAVVAVDAEIAARMARSESRLDAGGWTALLRDEEQEEERSRRIRTGTGALTVVALEELAAAAPRLAELQRRWTEPAMAAFLSGQHLDELPSTWC